jgi:archaemetzincin
MIRLVAIGTVARPILEFLAFVLEDDLAMTCTISPARLDVSEAYDPIRQQYHSTRILARLVEQHNDPLSSSDRLQKILGVADVDLFIPILTFVFGEAQLGRQAAVVSVYRLRQQFYGLPEDDSLLLHRSEKEALHELGHTFGLVHCPDFECVMHYSNSIEQVDLKSNRFCVACARLLPEPSQRGRACQGERHP